MAKEEGFWYDELTSAASIKRAEREKLDAARMMLERSKRVARDYLEECYTLGNSFNLIYRQWGDDSKALDIENSGAKMTGLGTRIVSVRLNSKGKYKIQRNGVLPEEIQDILLSDRLSPEIQDMLHESGLVKKIKGDGN